MSILIAFIAGAAFAALLMWWARRDGTASPEIHELRSAVNALATGHEGSRSETAAQLRTLVEAQRDVLRNTDQLSQALTKPAIRGQWGELTLVNVCEAAGLAEHVDFLAQTTVREDDEARAMRPDLVVNLPGGGHLCVDAKVPLDAFRDAINAADDRERNAALDRHAKQVKATMRSLSAKGYWRGFARAPELVVMFIPSEAAFAAAAQRDPALIEHAARQRVVIATPATMLALLQVVGLGWREHALSENTEVIRKHAAELVKRLAKVSEHLSKVGTSLDAAAKHHNDAVRSYEGRLLVTARKLDALGVAEAADLQEPTQVEVPIRLPVAPIDELRSVGAD
jgi:DNA recombination protein RmuC